MVDVVSPAKRSEMMAGIRSRNTRPEVRVRSLLHRAGYRFRLGSKIGPIKPDIVLTKWKTAIFVHGCFWHGHEQCHLYRLPKSRTDFWSAKIEANKERDRRTSLALLASGWNVIILWECSLKGRRRIPGDVLLQSLGAAIGAAPAMHEIAGVIGHTSPTHRFPESEDPGADQNAS